MRPGPLWTWPLVVGGYPVWVSGLEPHSVNGTIYYYVTNLQRDIVAILDESGTAVVQYTYDAWGKLLTTTGTLADTLGQHNPLRYRGYVYDTETGLYYVSSRNYSVVALPVNNSFKHLPDFIDFTGI